MNNSELQKNFVALRPLPAGRVSPSNPLPSARQRSAVTHSVTDSIRTPNYVSKSTTIRTDQRSPEPDRIPNIYEIGPFDVIYRNGQLERKRNGYIWYHNMMEVLKPGE
jgi:hypothetical protein